MVHIWLGIVHKTEKVVYSTLSSPVYFTITDVKVDGENTVVSSVISINGHNNFNPIDYEKSLSPGDYIIGLSLQHSVDEVRGMFVSVNHEPIDNLAMYQYISSLYRTVGYEPSVFLNQVAKSSSPSIALHRKIKTYIEELQATCHEANSEKLITLKKEYDALYEKLQEAENYIEELETNQKG